MNICGPCLTVSGFRLVEKDGEMSVILDDWLQSIASSNIAFPFFLPAHTHTYNNTHTHTTCTRATKQTPEARTSNVLEVISRFVSR